MSIRRLPARALYLVGHAFDSFSASAGSRDAAQIAFYLVMSFPAALLLVVWGFSTAFDDPGVKNSIVDGIVKTLPLAEDGRQQIEKLLDDIAAGAGGLGILSAISLLYSASGAIGSLRHGVNQAFGMRDDRPYTQGKVLDVGLTLLVAPLAVAALGLTLSRSIPSEFDGRPLIAGSFGFLVTDVLPLAILFGLLVVLFRALPISRASFRAAWPGALAALVALVVIQVASDIYFSQFGDTNALYGTIGVMLAVIFSFYLDAMAVVFGAHVAAEASRFQSGAAIDTAIEERRGKGRSFGRFLLDELKGLFVRVRPRRRDGG